MCSRRSSLIAIALLFCSQCAISEDLVCRWALSGGDIAFWDVRSLPVAEGEEEKPLGRSLSLVLYGYQIDRRGEAHFPVHRLDELAYDLALRIAPGRVREGGRLRLELSYDGIPSMPPIELQINAEITQVFGSKFRLEGKVTAKAPPAFDRRAHPTWTERVSALSAHFENVFDCRTGVVQSSIVEIDASIQTRDAPAGEKDPPPPRADRRRLAFELARVRDYAPARLDAPVGAAIEKGMTWLEGKVGADGTFGKHGNYEFGETALATLTLLVCGAPRDDPGILALMDKVRSFPPKNTYEVGVAMMAVESFYAPADEVTEVHAGRRAIPTRRKISPADLQWMQAQVDWLAAMAERRPAGLAWGYNKETPRADLSNTQYAALGLLSAWRCGARVPEELWVELGKCLFAYRSKGKSVSLDLEHTSDRPTSGSTTTTGGKRVDARGFGYTAGAASTASMTGAALTTLRIVRDVLRAEKSRHATGRLGKEIDNALEGAWAWLASNWVGQRHAPARGRAWLLYSLYGIERAAVLGNVRKVNGHDWYFEGASLLVGTQEDDGHWVNETGDVHHTCFALLFLRRGTIPVSTGD